MPLHPDVAASGNPCGAGMPGPEDLTQRLLWLGATQSLCARAEESGASAEIVELHQNDLSLDSLCHLPKPEFGCSRKRVHRQMRLAGIASVRHRACKITTNSRHSHPVAPTLLKRNSFFEQPNQAWGAILPAFPPERAGSIRPSSRACVPAKGWAMPFPVLLIPRHPGSAGQGSPPPQAA